MNSTAELPEWATIDEASRWLEDKTGEKWGLPRIIRAGVWTAVWLDYVAELGPEVFQGRTEGFLARMVFAGDVARMAVKRDGLLTMTKRPDGTHLKFTPGLRFELSDLRLQGKDLRRLCVKPTKRAALVREVSHQWPTIEADLSEASRNGLAAAAKVEGRTGLWRRDDALRWAGAHDKLRSPGPSALPSTVHRIKG